MKKIIINDTVYGFRFRRVEPRDKNLVMGVRTEIGDLAEFYRRNPDFMDYNWNLILKDENEVSMVVFQQPDNLFVGTCSFQGVQKGPLELGYDIVKEMRGKGIGTRMVGALFELAHTYFPARDIYVRIRKDNIASQRVAEKNGAKFLQTDDPPELVTLQKLLDENPNMPNAFDAMVTIERSRGSVRVYKV